MLRENDWFALFIRCFGAIDLFLFKFFSLWIGTFLNPLIIIPIVKLQSTLSVELKNTGPNQRCHSHSSRVLKMSHENETDGALCLRDSRQWRLHWRRHRIVAEGPSLSFSAFCQFRLMLIFLQKRLNKFEKLFSNLKRPIWPGQMSVANHNQARPIWPVSRSNRQNGQCQKRGEMWLDDAAWFFECDQSNAASLRNQLNAQASGSQSRSL